jgi:hypothetical protein
MATPSEKLAASLEELRVLQEQGHVAIQFSELSRTHRERLLKHGFLQGTIKGWYIPSRPDETAGESTTWYASYWQFCSAYLQKQKGDDWCLSPEQSISLHTENLTVPKQLLVRASKARNNVTQFPFGTSLLVARQSLPENKHIVVKNGLRLYSLPIALIRCSPSCFRNNPTDMRTALSMVRDASEVLEILLEGGHSVIAGRLAGAFRNIGRNSIANEIVQTMRAAEYEVRENDPFEEASPLIFPPREVSSYVNRLRLMWQQMRAQVIERFPVAPGLPRGSKTYLKQVEAIYTADAYHSLSIEGYRVTPELIEFVRRGDWNPDESESDRKQTDALAARGYWLAFQEVKNSIEKILHGTSSGSTASADHRGWYREMSAPSVAVGLLKPADLAGYRNAPVFIRHSKHMPPRAEVVRDAMPALFELLAEETEASVRIVLGHFIFVYIHPYMDGNGRMGRFLMNAMMASGGYPWLVIPVEERAGYMAALEEASVNQDIVPFVDFLAGLVEKG